MKAARILRFGPPNVIVNEDLPRPRLDVSTVLPFEQVGTAHEMLGGAPRKRGKIVLSVAACENLSGVGR